MNSFTLLAEAGGGGQIEQIARTFGVDWQHLIAQTISFCIVCALLYKFAYKRVLAMLEDRRRLIEAGLANAEKAKSQLESAEAQRLEVIGKANAEATRLIEEARTAAVKVGEKETQKAVAAAEQIIVQAHQVADRDHARMLGELTREVGRLVVQTTATVTGKVLTPEDQRRLSEETARHVTA